MTECQKLSNLKTILGRTDIPDEELTVYLDLTGQEIVQWKYSLVGVPEWDVVPREDEVTQIMACAAGYGHKGAPDQLSHNENGINRTWKHEDMVSYVRDHVIAYAGLR